ncbi:MAG: hypothetical protein R2742_10980 [Micropruina glycogenica]
MTANIGRATVRASLRAISRPTVLMITQIRPITRADPTSQGPHDPTWAAKKYQTAAPTATENAVEISR